MTFRRFVGDTLGLAASQYAARAVLLARGVVSAVALGPAGFGAWNALNLILDYGTFASGGVLQGLDLRLPGPTVRGEAREARRLLAGAWNVVLLGGTLTVMLLASPVVTLSILALMVPIVVGTFFFLRYIRRAFRTIRKLFARISAFLVEYIQGIPILQIYGYTEKAKMDLVRLNRDMYSRQTRVYLREYAFWGAFSSVEIAAVMLIIWLSRKTYPGFGCWTAGSGLFCLAFLLSSPAWQDVRCCPGHRGPASTGAASAMPRQAPNRLLFPSSGWASSGR